MALPTLESADVAMDAAALAVLGDELSFTPAGGGTPVTRGFVDYGERARDFGAAAGIEQDIVVELPIDGIDRPSDGARITFPLFAGKIFKPRDVTIRDGAFWRFGVKEV